MTLSGLSAMLIGLTFGGPPLLTGFPALFWGSTVIADSAQFSTAITELSPPADAGTALTPQTCLDFALTMISIRLIPPLVSRLGRGAAAMGCRRALPEALEPAQGRR
jgi:hypothetical protein